MYNDMDDRSGMLKAGVNGSDKHILPSNEYEANQKKKKYIIGGAVVGVAVLALILGLTLGGGDPDPGPPPIVEHYNPYKLSDEDIEKIDYKVNGVIKAS